MISCKCFYADFYEGGAFVLQVTDILQANEFTKDFTGPNSVKSYDSNQLASNNPIEDTRSEARCLLTNGIYNSYIVVILLRCVFH